MNFDDWFARQSKDPTQPITLRSAWQSATLIEREACATLAESHFIYGHSIAGPHFAAELAAKIRMRPNVELRGSEAVPLG